MLLRAFPVREMLRFLYLALWLLGLGGLAWSQPAPRELFTNFNTEWVENGPSQSPTIVFEHAWVVTQLQTYHWNQGRGMGGGQPVLGLLSQEGRFYGPWKATLSGGSGASNIFCLARPYARVPAGRYTVVDPDPNTWSRNQASGGLGFASLSCAETTEANDCPVTPSDRSQTITSPEGVAITIPPGLVQQPTTAALQLLGRENPSQSGGYFRLGDRYDISLGGMRDLSQPVQITLPLDPGRVTDRYPLREVVEAVRWDEQNQGWLPIPGKPTPDRKGFSFSTRHLCPFGLIYFPGRGLPVPVPPNEASVFWGPDSQYKLTVLWKDGPYFRQATKAYNETYRTTSTDPNMPPYVRQAFRSAYQALQAYGRLGFHPATQSVHLYLQPVDSSYQSGLTHDIYVNLACQSEDELAYVVSHELFHNIQGSYYSLSQSVWRRWWLEATAEYAASRIALKHYPAMGKLEAGNPAASLSGMLSRRPLDYSYTHKGWLESSIDWLTGETGWDQRHAYRGAYFVEYLVKALVYLQNGQTTNAEQFKGLCDAVAASGQDGDDPLKPIIGYFQRYSNFNFGQLYSLYAAYIYTHRQSPLHPPPAQHHLRLGAPLSVEFRGTEGPVSFAQGVEVEYDGELQAEVAPTAEPDCWPWLLVLPGGKPLALEPFKALWQAHQRPVVGNPARLQVKPGDVVMVLGIMAGRKNSDLRVTLSPKGPDQGGYWSLVRTTHQEAPLGGSSSLSHSAGGVEGRLELNGHEARGWATWSPFPARIPADSSIEIRCQPGLQSDLDRPVAVSTRLFAQMLEIRPPHLTTVADSKSPQPSPTVFRITWARAYQPVRLPISVTVNLSFAGQVTYTYEYDWIMPGKK